MSQTKIGSAVEVAVNLVVGQVINFIANMLVLPLFGFDVSADQAIAIGIIFTVISVVRSYTLRRVFNYIKFGNRSGA